MDYFAKPVPSTILVLCHKHKSLDKRKELGKKAGDYSFVHSFKKPYQNQLPEFVQGYFSEKGFKADQNGIQLLCEYVGTDLSRLANEIDKLLIGKTIEEAIQQPGQQDGTGQGGEGAVQEGTLADRQQALRDELERQRGNLPAMTGDAADAAEDALNRAETAMDQAEQALRDGDLAAAIDNQAQAMDALRDSLRNLGRALAENEVPEDQGGAQTGDATGRIEPSRRDPLGREIGNTGQYGSEESMLQGQDIYRRAEDLLNEIRRRAGQQERPEGELDYLRRLLDRF